LTVAFSSPEAGYPTRPGDTENGNLFDLLDPAAEKSKPVRSAVFLIDHDTI
jgi:hypothetical protein